MTHCGMARLETPFGPVWIEADGAAVRRVHLERPPGADGGAPAPLAAEAARALGHWLEGGPWPRHLPLAPEGTPFRQRVWKELLGIPPGRRCTYGELAARLETAPRAVGGACRANPIPLLIPCHRVVAADGPGGFAGARTGRYMEIKRWLLDHEGSRSC